MNSINSKWIYLFALSIIWGSSFILIKKSLLGLTAYQLGALRVIISGFFLLIFGYSTLKTIKKSDWKWIAISGLIGSFVPSFFFAIAETEIDSAVVSILNSLVPLNTILIGFAVFKITSTKRQMFGVIIGFIGTVMLILKGADLNPNQNYLYAIFVILSTLMYATNINIVKRHLQHVKPLTIATGSFASIIIPGIIVLLFTGFFSVETFVNPKFKIAMVYTVILSLFCTALALVLFNKLVHMSTPVFASSVTFVMPIVALILGFLDGESFSLLQGIAGIIILLGVYLSHKRQKKSS
ncbi:DMT family transporter [Flavivirga eckloniae]|uniref:Permease n=1 Tax=Flavivirga eckloniae TaxID=1803846 RepID=A0A2K9PRZ3_9FLAO|nr:EamA family transporter [Flavivirga eckloniae]AUP79840.1 permease [Flavivirga eckloniae]